MTKTDKRLNKGDALEFADESPVAAPVSQSSHFKLLIVDDENEVHIMTKLVLSDYQYNGSGLEFLSAFSGKEAKAMLRLHPDIACVLLDVVMETKDAGLEVARFIREDEKNTKIRIVLRTGQPGKAPEKDIILNYDINDYKEKTELTTQKLFTTITTALRSYIHLEALEAKSREVESKNIRLNEEIARRIVAESNLTKYNRSLEKMIENKSARLENAINTLKEKEDELRAAKRAAVVSDLSAASVDSVGQNGEKLQSNLETMNQYRREMTLLLEKYTTLQDIIFNAQRKNANVRNAVKKTILEIEEYKNEIDLETILAKYPDIIKDSTLGIRQIADAVADIKRFISINDEPFDTADPNRLIQNAAQAVKKKMAPEIDLQMDLKAVPRISLPQANMVRAFGEIIKNACQAVGSRGIVSITSQHADPEIILRISDIGCGIPPEDLPRIFKPYFKAKGKSGKGLGLTLARSIILGAGGDISVTSTHTEGTTVSVTLRSGGSPAPD